MAMICRICCFVTVMGIFSLLPFITASEARLTQAQLSTANSQTVYQDSQDQSLVHVYFADRLGHYLQAEERNITPITDALEKGRWIVKALIKGPKTDLIRTIPVGARLNAFYLGQGGRAYVDLSENLIKASPGGCKSEILTVYSIVNSLILNTPEIKSVKILVNGREMPTLAGHVDSRYPFTADMLLIR